MKISMKIALGFGILIALVWIIGIFSYTSFNHSSNLFNRMDTETIPRLTAVNEMGRKVAEAHVEFVEFLLSGKISARDNVSGITRTLETLAGVHTQEAGSDENRKQTAMDLQQKIGIFASSVVEVMDMKTRGSSDEDLLAAEEKTVRPVYDEMMRLLAGLNKSYQEQLTLMRSEVKNSQNQGQIIIIVIALAAMILGLILSVMTERKIAQPIKHLTQIADNISRGDISRPVEKESTDEIGDLADAFERMRVSLKVMMEEE